MPAAHPHAQREEKLDASGPEAWAPQGGGSRAPSRHGSSRVRLCTSLLEAATDTLALPDTHAVSSHT